MGNEEAGTPMKSEKASSPAQEQSNIHAYPNWAAVQAYYGPGIPPPYFNSAAASGHPPHPYMWGAHPHLMSPYGTPYAAMYPPGGVYAHPSFHGSQGLGSSSSLVASDAMVVTPLSMTTPDKSSSSKDQGLIKKLKGLDGSAVSIANGNSGSSAASHSGDCGAEGSTDGSDEHATEQKGQMLRKRSAGMSSTVKDETVDALTTHGGEANTTSSMAPIVVGKPVGTIPSRNGKARTVATMSSPAIVAELPSQDGVESGHLTKDERELKRERRKQSNRESARRSRLRKQAEAEELAVKVETLDAENLALRSEINQLKEGAEKLRLENASLMEELKTIQLEGAGEEVSNSMEAQEGKPVSTENFLSRVENSLASTRGTHREIETNEHSNSGTKLHQLLASSPRADAVAAS
ncbi:G-box binding factor [Thalictrum thalictroides]|uniref:G-box binding factor n=1 Tax=Thalictrum thalictroides TaxID=46969 RepID=A0A7J6VUM3_THATH|nr:G-box binding factor [Thalictrum thalictroides]